jgi:hypothetical protein
MKTTAWPIDCSIIHLSKGAGMGGNHILRHWTPNYWGGKEGEFSTNGTGREKENSSPYKVVQLAL